jgi:hypothetical protein
MFAAPLLIGFGAIDAILVAQAAFAWRDLRSGSQDEDPAATSGHAPD